MSPFELGWAYNELYIKTWFMPQKITEPKTPWHELLPDNDIDLPALDLDGNGEVAGLTATCMQSTDAIGS